MDEQNKKYWMHLLLYSPALLAILIMIPRLVSPNLGLLDDPTNIYSSQQILNGDWSWVQGLNTGRFKPGFFLVFTIYYAIAGMNPLAYFIINTIILILVTCSLIFLIHRQSQKKMIAWWSGILFVLSSPVIENFYTVYKQEPTQVALILGAVLLTGQINKVTSRYKKTILSALIMLLVFTAVSLKETSIIIIPIAVSWYVGALILKRNTGEETDQSAKQRFMIITVCSGLIFILLWFWTKHSVLANEGIHFHYSFEPNNIMRSIREWERWIRRDFFFLYFLAAPVILRSIHKRSLPCKVLVVDTFIWMVGWLVIFLPWMHQLDYYLLPFTLGTSVLGAVCISQIKTILKNGGLFYRAATITSLCLASFFFVATLPNNFTNARLQLTIDKQDMDFIAFVSDELPEEAILLLNIQEPSEYHVTITRFINVHNNRADIQINQLEVDHPQIEDTDDGYYYIATPVFNNQFYRSVRLGFSADGTKKWNELIAPLLDGKEEIVFETFGSFRLFLVEIRLGCFVRDVPAYCDIPTIPLDRRELTYGWKVYRIPIQH